jgi:hypothetical protein
MPRQMWRLGGRPANHPQGDWLARWVAEDMIRNWNVGLPPARLTASCFRHCWRSCKLRATITGAGIGHCSKRMKVARPFDRSAASHRYRRERRSALVLDARRGWKK